MKSTKLKVIFLGLSCFAVASTSAQDSPNMPKPDTTKMPRHDSTSKNSSAMNSNVVGFNFKASDSFIVNNENIAALKQEAEEETLTEKYLAKTSA